MKWTGLGCDVCGFGSVEDVDAFDPQKPCSQCSALMMPPCEGGDCVGPYGPSGEYCCLPCANVHQAAPKVETCRCDWCASKRLPFDVIKGVV